MGRRKITVKESAAESIAAISWYLESEGLLATAEKFTDDAYDLLKHWPTIGKSIGHAGSRSGL